jgi:hypothetical protein
MNKALLARMLIGLFLICWPVLTHAAGGPPTFQNEQAAQQHCPKDIVVWLNLPSGIYHFKGQRYYANTKAGSYVCKQEADQAGDRATRNGQ